MRLGFIGLGRMGANMVRRLVRDGHEIMVYNRTPEKSKEIEGEGENAVDVAPGGAAIFRFEVVPGEHLGFRLDFDASQAGVVMAVEHATLPLAAVQFHPESIMTLGGDVGLRLLANVMSLLARGV